MVEFSSEAVWLCTFAFWGIFDYWPYLFPGYLCFLFLPLLVLVVYMFLGIYLFLPSCPICGHTVFLLIVCIYVLLVVNSSLSLVIYLDPFSFIFNKFCEEFINFIAVFQRMCSCFSLICSVMLLLFLFVCFYTIYLCSTLHYYFPSTGLRLCCSFLSSTRYRVS